MLIIDGVKYKLWTPKDEEKEFHPMVRARSKEIFGEDSIYFDVKRVLKTVSGIGSIPDAYVIALSKPHRLYVVENELATHPIYDHIVKQLTKFINGIGNQNARSQIIDMLYDQINRDSCLRETIQKLVGLTDVYRFLSKLLSEPPRIVIIIDKKTAELEEACYSLRYQPDIVEFKTFVREDDQNIRAHLFEPIHPTEEGGPPTDYENWEKKLAKTSNDVRATVKELEERILGFGKISTIQRTRKAYYKGKHSLESCFAIFEITDDALIARIRADSTTFEDPEKWSIGGTHKGMFFNPENKFKITSKDQVGYAIGLIKQAYEISKSKK
jgi:predicted transport protein